MKVSNSLSCYSGR